MWLSVAFPTCPSCRNNSHKCYHRDCSSGGKKPMEINPDTSYVRCPSCGESWHINKSNYYCTCNYVFSANEVSDEINAIVANAKLIANELKRNAETWQRMHSITNRDIEIKTKETIKSNFGEKVWDVLKSFLPTIVEAVKKWLGL